MASQFQLLPGASLLALMLLTPAILALPAQQTISGRPKSVSLFSPAGAAISRNNLYSSVLSNGRIASALYGPRAYRYHPMPGFGNFGLGEGLAAASSYNSGYSGLSNPYNTGFNAHYLSSPLGTGYESLHRSHFGLGQSAVTSRKGSSYVSNNFGYPALGNSYEHSTSLNVGVGPGSYVPIGGAKYGQYGSYNPFGYGAHGAYRVSPGFTHITHTQTVPNSYVGVTRLRGYGR